MVKQSKGTPFTSSESEMVINDLSVYYVHIIVGCCFVQHLFLLYAMRKEMLLKELQINEQIRDREVRLIGDDGQQYGVISIREARQIAEEQGLDLCKVSPPSVQPPTCKLMNYGKYRYDQQKREKEAKKNQKVMEIKEIRLSATIDVGDTTRLAAQSRKFLQEGNKVKASIRLKGRQQAHPEIAINIVKDYISMVGEGVVVEKQPAQEGRIIYTILAPQQKK